MTQKNKQAFTIVELLVVIVIIGVLAAITIVSYTGISQRATVATLQSDLSNNSRMLELYKSENGFYPTAFSVNDCPSAPVSDSKYCIKYSSGNTYYYSSDGTSFSLVEINSSTNIAYKITSAGGLVATVPSFVYTLGGANYEIVNGSAPTADGGYAITGQTTSYGVGSGDVFTAKFNANGTLAWNKTWGGSGADYGNGITSTSDGGFVVVGNSNSFSGPNMFIIKYDTDGNLLWNKTWGGGGYEVGYAVDQTADGGLVVAGITSDFGTLNDMMIVKFASDGAFVWNKSFGETINGGMDAAYAISATSDGGCVVSGKLSANSGSNVTLLKLTADGSKTWAYTWDGSTAEYGYSVIQTSDGGYAVTGQTLSYGAGSGDMFINKYTSTGTLSWNKTWGGTNVDSGQSIIQTSDGGYAVVGFTRSFGAGSDDIFIVKYDASGNVLWNKTLGGAAGDQALSVFQTSEGGYFVAGYSYSFGGSNGEAIAIKYTSDGSIYGCPSSACKTPTATIGTPSATTAASTAYLYVPAATVVSPSATVMTPTANLVKVY